jgi:diacylglycerol kinase family enzyme
MKTVLLIHNPGAGDEAHSRSALIQLIESAGYVCRYSSTKEEEWQDIDPRTDFIVIAGGDGTIKKVVSVLLRKEQAVKEMPIAILPLGTANNIAESLNIRGEFNDIIHSWNTDNTTAIDVGEVDDSIHPSFFIEGFGYGLFPYVIKEMQLQGKNNIDNKQIRLKEALRLMHDFSHSYKPHYCELYIDGKDYSGSFLMVEIMNTRFIGPNLFLSPHGHPGDGTFEVVLIPGEDQAKFAAYIDSKINDAEDVYSFTTVKAEDIRIKWEGAHVHIDDELPKFGANEPVHVHVKENALIFLV